MESAVAEVFAVADLDEMVIDPVPFALGVLAYVVFVAAFAEAVIEHNKQTAKALVYSTDDI